MIRLYKFHLVELICYHSYFVFSIQYFILAFVKLCRPFESHNNHNGLSTFKGYIISTNAGNAKNLQITDLYRLKGPVPWRKFGYDIDICYLLSLTNMTLVAQQYKKSRIRETKHLSTNADSSTDTTLGWTEKTQFF